LEKLVNMLSVGQMVALAAKRDDALAGLERALSDAALTPDDEHTLARLRTQDTSMIEGTTALLWAVRAAERSGASGSEPHSWRSATRWR
jgi:hypothetical protein